MNKTEQQQTIEAIKAADTNETDWYYGILNGINDQYAKGYLTARIESRRDFDAYTEDARDLLVRWCGYSIWK